MALRVNTVSCICPSSLRSSLSRGQTLTALNLGWNGIGDVGTDRLTEMLKVNRVEGLAHRFVSILSSSQTLTSLDLGGNGIRARGAQRLATALKENEVSCSFTSFPSLDSKFGRAESHCTFPRLERDRRQRSRTFGHRDESEASTLCQHLVVSVL